MWTGFILASAFILAFINSFNDVSIGVFVTSPGTMTLPTAMMGYIQGRMDPTIAAASVLLMLMTMLLMVLSENSRRCSEISSSD